MNKDLEKRAIENVVEYAAAIASLGGERRCRQPKKVEMFKLTDQYDDLWESAISVSTDQLMDNVIATHLTIMPLWRFTY